GFRRVWREYGRLAGVLRRTCLPASRCYGCGNLNFSVNFRFNLIHPPYRAPDHLRNLGLREFWKLFDAYLNRTLLVSRRPPQPVSRVRSERVCPEIGKGWGWGAVFAFV
ncbi:MAG TPA: hypothetical protein PLZ74_05325, partial [Kiritimatiellia bacterium]|nr:hypothetical protein [Kiritimatiellia bacterium]